jgi:indole-3-glycerol phosphate synthase
MNRLHEIFENKRREVSESKKIAPLAAIREAAASAEPPRGFLAALKNSSKRPALIAEVKKASPSMGLIRAEFNAVSIAKAFEAAGADALSVLTDEKYFQGSASNLQRVREAVSLPLLRKDFVDDPYQVFEARAWGADAILLILAALDRSNAQDLLELSRGIGMDTLVEVHDLFEAELAMKLGAKLIGVNNRSLHTFKTDIDTSVQILPQLVNAFRVAESALNSHEDMVKMKSAGADAVLIGTAFCSTPDIESKVKEVMGW